MLLLVMITALKTFKASVEIVTGRRVRPKVVTRINVNASCGSDRKRNTLASGGSRNKTSQEVVNAPDEEALRRAHSSKH